MPSFVVRELGSMLAVLAVAYGLGSLALLGLEMENPLEAISFRTAAGLGALSCVVLFLAVVHGLHPVSLGIGVLVLAAILAAPRWKRVAAAVRLRGFDRDPAVWLLLVVAALLSVPALYPPTGFDAVFYHLPVARLHVVTNSLASSPYLHLNFMPQAWELLQSLSLLVADDVLAQLLHAAAMVLVGLGCVGAVRRIGDGRAAALAGALWLGSPAIGPIAASAYVDVGLTLFVLAGALAVGRWLETDRPAWLAAGAFFLGLAASTKYIGLVFAGLAGLAVLAVSIARRRAIPVILFGGIVTVVFLPWLLRTYAMTGTPFGYFGSAIFGDGTQDPFDVAKWAAHMRAYGYPRTLGNFAALPWNLLVHPDRFLEYQRLSPWLLVGLPFAVVGAVTEKRARWPVALAGGYVVVWFLEYQNTRFLLPVLPLAAIGVAAGMQWALGRAKLPRLAESLVVLFLTGAILWPSATVAWAEARRLGPVPATAAERDRYLAPVAGYEALRRLNETLGDRYTVYSFLMPSPVYYARGRFIGNWFGPHRYETVLPLLRRPADLSANLRSFGVTHLLVSKTRFERVMRSPFSEWAATLGPSFRSIYSDANVELFEVPKAD